MEYQIVIAGFGGQGLLFSGKVLAYAALMEQRELSWLPSYGPEMRGGTANCNVIISDSPVGSPIVQNPNVLMVMNTPSLDKYEKSVAPGGKIFVDSTGAQVPGTMANNGAVAASIDGLTVTEYTIPKGYHNGSGKVSFVGTIETWSFEMESGSIVTKRVVVS